MFLYVHALAQMRRRNITRDEIVQALAAVETRYPSADDPGRVVTLGRTLDGRRLKIVTEADDMEAVVTVADRDREE